MRGQRQGAAFAAFFVLVSVIAIYAWADAYAHWRSVGNLKENGTQVRGLIADKWIRQSQAIWERSSPTRHRSTPAARLDDNICRHRGRCWYEVQIFYTTSGREHRLIEEVGRSAYDSFAVGQTIRLNVDPKDSRITRMVGSTHRDDKYVPAIAFAVLWPALLGIAIMLLRSRAKPLRRR
jgi:hypothetical protein